MDKPNQHNTTALTAGLLAPMSTVLIDQQLDVRQRLMQLAQWQSEWTTIDKLLEGRVLQLNPDNKIDRQRAAQIQTARRRVRLQQVKHPIEISAPAEPLDWRGLRQHFVPQFAGLSQQEKLLWLKNGLFIVTPDLRRINDKVVRMRDYRTLGQQRCFLLGGYSGMGKTTYLDWLASCFAPHVETERNVIPFIKISAPVSNNTAKPLLQRLLLECGATFVTREDEEELLRLLGLYFQRCSVEIVAIDEIEHIRRDLIRRRLLELSNETLGVTYICASCHPQRWTDGDTEVQGRWNDNEVLRPYTGSRLRGLLAFIELLLPFTKESSLALSSIKTEDGKTVPGPAHFIEGWTKGVLRDIMILLMDASQRAIAKGDAYLSLDLLQTTWDAIQAKCLDKFTIVSKQGTGE